MTGSENRTGVEIENDVDRVTLAELSEGGVLARIFPRLPTSTSALLGPGDDAAVLASSGRFVVTTDLMVQGPDFLLGWSTPFDLGWKSAATNLSDVAAMGAVPTALLVAIAAPSDTPVTVLEGIADGLRKACAVLAPECGVVGGDLSTSSVLTIAVTAFGDLEGKRAVLRSGAVAGDVVAHAGRRGDAARGLRLLFENALDEAGQPDPVRAFSVRTRWPDLVDAQLRPAPPIAQGSVAASAGATAMLDVSDGLAKDAMRIAEASHVGIRFHSVALGDDPLQALHGGEDHGLLATFSPAAAIPTGFDVVGEVTDDSGVIWLDGKQIDPGGWDPYRATEYLAEGR